MVVSSYGHILDLHSNKLSVDIENNFTPEYTTIKGSKFQDKSKVIKDLIQKASNASKVIIAADNDREGEMIGWCYKYVLKLKDDQYEIYNLNIFGPTELHWI
jgi:DNA topoisomerase-1